jgi:hypothetical protein
MIPTFVSERSSAPECSGMIAIFHGASGFEVFVLGELWQGGTEKAAGVECYRHEFRLLLLLQRRLWRCATPAAL